MVKELIKKEIHLQKSLVLFAGFLYLAWFIAFLLSFGGNRFVYYHFLRMGTLAQILHNFFVMPLLIVIFPLMAGASSTASERSLNTKGWQHSLPMHRHTQWLIKVVATCALAFVLGGVIPTILDRILVWNLRARNVSYLFFGKRDILAVPLALKGLWPGVYSLIFCSMGIYISSFSRDTFKAFLITFLLIFLTFIIRRLPDPCLMLTPIGWQFPKQHLHPLAHHLNTIFLSLVLLVLGYGHFKQEELRKRWLWVHLVIWIVVVWSGSAIALKVEFGPGRFRDKTETAHPGITKLLGTPDTRLVSALYSIPQSNLVVTSVMKREDILRYEKKYLSKMYKKGAQFSQISYSWYDMGRLVKMDVKSGDIIPINNLFGKPEYIDPDGDYFYVETPNDHMKTVLRSGFVPPPLIDRVYKKFKGAPEWEPSDISLPQFGVRFIHDHPCNKIYHTLFFTSEFKQFKRFLTIEIFNENRGQFDFLLRQSNASPKESESIPLYDIIDCQPGTSCFRLTPDEKWYTARTQSYHPRLQDIYDPGKCTARLFYPLEIIKTDQTTTYTLKPQGTSVFVPVNRACLWYDSRWDLRRIYDKCQPLGYTESYYLDTSPGSRYLPFCRAIGGNMNINGREYPHVLPQYLELFLLDLESGEEIKLRRISASQDVLQKRKKVEQRLETSPKDTQEVRKIYRTYLNYHFDSGVPSIAWSRQGKLAVRYDNVIYLFEPGSPGGKYHSKGEIGMKGLSGAECSPGWNMDFFTEDLILLWHELAIFKVDLEKALEVKS